MSMLVSSRSIKLRFLDDEAQVVSNCTCHRWSCQTDDIVAQKEDDDAKLDACPDVEVDAVVILTLL